jgi:NAD(P)H-flavin reductase
VADVLTLPVRAVIAATPRTRILRLDLKDTPFVFRAGQAALIGLHGQPQRRPYSIASSPEDAARHKRLEFLLKVDDTGYGGPHLSSTGAHLGRHGRIDLEGPFGSFTLPEPDTRADNGAAAGYLFIAGGTGISPLRSMMRQLISRGDHRPISVIYSARTIDEFAYKPELQRLARQGRISLTLTVTGDVREDAGDPWRGERGRISASRLAQALPAPDPLCFICGPPALVEDVPPLLLQLGVKSARIRTEEW